MTRKVFWENPYQTCLDTCITSVNGSTVTVAETIFFAFSGGQESDSGTIGGYPVAEAVKKGKIIEYTLPPDHALKTGDPARIEIDWERRYKLMRLHFAAELVLELMYNKLQRAEKIGAHISADKARIDFYWHESIKPLLSEVAAEAENTIRNDHEIISEYSDKTNERRYWKINGLATVPCGGTHLKTTGEVGPLKLKRKNIGKGKERVEIFLALVDR